MGRRQSILDDLVDIASALPWWVSILMAIVAWVALGAYANSEITAVATNPTAMMTESVSRSFAQLGQYILTIAFGLGAIISAGRAYRNGTLLRGVAKHYGQESRSLGIAGGRNKPDPLLAMTWRDFEHLVGEIYRRQGYTVLETPSSADGGVDLVLRRNGEQRFVQCKHWRSRSVGVSVVRELHGVIAAHGAAGGAIVTAGRFTPEAREFAKRTKIELLEGDELRQQAWLADGIATLPLNVPGPTSADTESGCPRCGSAMVQRVARVGPNAGGSFWGCSRYPKCRGIRSRA